MSRSKNPAPMLAVLIILGLIGAGLYLLFKDTTGPELALVPEITAVSPERTLNISVADPGSGLQSLKVTAVQGQKQRVILERQYTTLVNQVDEAFTLADSGLADGPLSLEITATDASLAGFGKGNTTFISREMVLDSVKPAIAVRSGAHNIRRGGAGCVIYTVADDAVLSGVQVGELFFPGYRQESGEHYCLFAYPWYMDEANYQPRLVAKDLAGNEAVRGFRVNLMPRDFKNDTIQLSDGFLDSKMPEFESLVPGQMSNLERYLHVNRDVRKQNRGALLTIGLDTAPRQLWKGAFDRMAGAPMAGFGDHRSYLYKGEKVDEQTHLGVDIASTKHAPVPAANDGDIVFAGEMGIYGQVVIIDHGLGLQSLHAHLSRIDVAAGDHVTRGQTIGLTGMTGLAGGDHLHLGVLVSGIPVTPVEWWDDQWIRHNVTDRMEISSARGS